VTPDDDRDADEAAIRELSASYAAAADGRDGAALARQFTDDGVLVVAAAPDGGRPAAVHRGAGALARIPGLLDRYEWTLHQVVDHRLAFGPPVDGRPATATGTVRCVAHHVSRHAGAPGAVGTDTVWYLHYLDDYRREPAGWRIARRVLEVEWVEERPVALLAQRDCTGRGGGGPT